MYLVLALILGASSFALAQSNAKEESIRCDYVSVTQFVPKGGPAQEPKVRKFKMESVRKSNVQDEYTIFTVEGNQFSEDGTPISKFIIVRKTKRVDIDSTTYREISEIESATMRLDNNIEPRFTTRKSENIVEIKVELDGSKRILRSSENGKEDPLFQQTSMIASDGTEFVMISNPDTIVEEDENGTFKELSHKQLCQIKPLPAK